MNPVRFFFSLTRLGGKALWRWKDLVALAVIGVCWVLARRVYSWDNGVPFDDTRLAWSMQFLDPAWLRETPWRSLWFLHSQPPLFNAYLAAILNLFPGQETRFFALSYRLLGVLLAVSLYGLQRAIGITRFWAVAVTVLVCCAPAALIYERYLFYTYPVAALIAVAGVFAWRFVEKGWRVADGLVLFTLLGALIFTRSMFHPFLWLLPMAAGFCWMAGRGKWRRVALLAAIPMVASLALFTKNAFLFGEFTSSSWLGMSLGKYAVRNMSQDELAAYLTRDDFPAIFAVETFEPVDDYRPYLPRPLAEPTGVPALDADRKATGAANMNHLQFIAASNEFGRGAKIILLNDPGYFLRTFREALIVYSKPATDYVLIALRERPVDPITRWYARIVYGKFGPSPFHYKEIDGWLERQDKHRLEQIGWFLPIYLLLGIGVGVAVALALIRERRRPTGSEFLILFLAFNVLYVSGIGTLLEVGENNRFRYQIEPVLFVLVAAAIQRLAMARTLHRKSPPFWTRWRRRR
ncbi:MAG: hypothetical protein RLY93_00420 [Sumerlaeia bacterium]